MTEKALPTTKTAVAAVLRADPVIDDDTVKEIMAILEGKAEKAETPAARPLVKRAELKRLTGLTVESIDRYARKGFLVRVHLGGSSRATGFTPESVDAFLAGRAAAATTTTATGMEG